MVRYPLHRSAVFAVLVLAAPLQAQPLPAAADFPAARVRQPGCAVAEVPPTAPVALPELVDIALCRAPSTRAAWAGVRAASEREVQARAAYGPRFDAAVGPDVGYTRTSGGGLPVFEDSSASVTAALSLNWLLYDFGGREARIDAAEAGRAGALASFADRAQAVVLETGIAYNSAIAAAQSVEAATANLRFAQTSLDAATARERAGIAIKSDRLQADAAQARALLQLRQAEGSLETQQGRLAAALSFAPTVKIPLAGPTPIGAAALLRQSADSLIAAADRLRPDLQLQQANAAQARAIVAQAEAARRPSVSLGAGPSVTAGTSRQDIATGSAGLTLSIPLGDSGGRTSVVREARATAEQAEANLEDSRRLAALDVWSRYQTLVVDAANLDTARRLFASAEEAAALAQGRYRSGLTTITELLDAQSSLALARQQLVLAELDVRSSELQLARSVGQIGDANP